VGTSLVTNPSRGLAFYILITFLIHDHSLLLTSNDAGSCLISVGAGWLTLMNGRPESRYMSPTIFSRLVLRGSPESGLLSCTTRAA
jgi:hypothetical protein